MIIFELIGGVFKLVQGKGHPVAHFGLHRLQPLRAVGQSQGLLVAGAEFGTYFRGLRTRIRLT